MTAEASAPGEPLPWFAVAGCELPPDAAGEPPLEPRWLAEAAAAELEAGAAAETLGFAACAAAETGAGALELVVANGLCHHKRPAMRRLPPGW